MKGNTQQATNPHLVGQAEKAARPLHPIRTFPAGNVRARIWPHASLLGDVTFTVDIVLVYVREGKEAETRSFDYADLEHVQWAAYQARRWIRKFERNRRILRLAFWL